MESEKMKEPDMSQWQGMDKKKNCPYKGDTGLFRGEK
jgi:hypothetical protein